MVLHGVVEECAVVGPLRGSVAEVELAGELVGGGAVGVHDPEMGVLPGGLHGGDGADGVGVGDQLAVRRPDGGVFGAYGVG